MTDCSLPLRCNAYIEEKGEKDMKGMRVRLGVGRVVLSEEFRRSGYALCCPVHTWGFRRQGMSSYIFEFGGNLSSKSHFFILIFISTNGTREENGF